MDGIYQIQKLVNAIGGSVDFVIIRNEVHGGGFDLFDKSKLRQKLLNDLGAKEIQVTQMRKWLVEGLQKSKLTVTAAKTTEDFSFMDRQLLKLWQETFYAQIETVKEFLPPTDAAQPKN
ncbi:MAG: hypothetical protein ACREFR_15785 [Limisphaerales bacterium]